jgi:hypothetical protein
MLIHKKQPQRETNSDSITSLVLPETCSQDHPRGLPEVSSVTLADRQAISFLYSVPHINLGIQRMHVPVGRSYFGDILSFSTASPQTR